MNSLQDKTILITGGTGSFGHACLDRLLRTDVKEIRVFSRDELKQFEMRSRINNPKVKFYIGDVRDRMGVEKATQGVDYVFHAAALKQVPSCEFFPMQAVMTNVIGSNNVLESCIRNGVKRVVMLSTDKAVYPVNAMGTTKALMERVAAAHSRSVDHTAITCVRYGNVMCSRGSVIPLFLSQIKNNMPITITVPEMTRFLLKLSDAIELVLFAFNHGEQGDLFIKKAPSCTIGDLAAVMKKLFRSEVPINIIGMRHGEKMHETLASREELCTAEDHGDYYRIPIDSRDLNYGRYFSEGAVGAGMVGDYTSQNTRILNRQEIADLLLSLPEFAQEMSPEAAAAAAH